MKKWTDRFLTAANHQLALGYLGDVAAGFITGVQMTHPDKGTEMFLYELGVGERAFHLDGLTEDGLPIPDPSTIEAEAIAV